MSFDVISRPSLSLSNNACFLFLVLLLFAMFKFKFNEVDNEPEESHKEDIIQWHNAREVIPQCEKIFEDNFNVKTFECENVKLKYVSSDDVIVNLINSDDKSSVLQAETNHSDLVAGEYEGGLKIWECTSDLINHLSSENITLTNKKVLDLGCGAGMLGIYALSKGSLVDFQDYNHEVIEHTTIPNVAINSNTQENHFENCKFFCGDWKSFMELATNIYDYIFTSETIYNPDNHYKLLNIFNQLLKPGGVVFLAAKTYYFGVGGGIRQFEALLKKDGNLNSNICWKNSTGVQREILKIFRK